MDSLTQIVLGAAAGEAVLGKKIGNRAIVLGAIGGTIPDLDVIPGNLFMTPIEAMDFHRGISHSFLFSAVAPLLVGGITYLFYKKEGQYNKTYRTIVGGIPLVLFLGLLAIAIYSAISVAAYSGAGIALLVGLLFLTPLYRYIVKTPKDIEQPSFMNWYWFFFWTFITHILLDALTTYGTQLFLPFSNYRAELGSIAIVDPLYTLPFIFFVLLASLMRRKAQARRVTNWIGIILSSVYLLWGIYAKMDANEAVRTSLKDAGVEYKRFMTTPTLFNTLMWSTTVETDSAYLLGAYSRFDPVPKVMHFTAFPKNHHLLAGHENDPDVEILTRFADYYMVNHNADSTGLTMQALKWGSIKNMMKNVPSHFPEGMEMHLKLIDGEYKLVEIEKEKKEDGGVLENLTRLPKILQDLQKENPTLFQDYWDRIMGRWQYNGPTNQG